jgi:hypothetical protein
MEAISYAAALRVASRPSKIAGYASVPVFTGYRDGASRKQTSENYVSEFLGEKISLRARPARKFIYRLITIVLMKTSNRRFTGDGFIQPFTPKFLEKSPLVFVPENARQEDNIRA